MAQVAPDVCALNGRAFRVEEAAEQRLEARIEKERHVRLGQGRYGDDWRIEVKCQSEVGDVGAGVSRGQGSEAKTPFDQLEDRGVIEDQMIHCGAVLDAASEGRRD